MWSTLIAFASRLRASVSRGRLDDEARRECEAHFELLTERSIRAGMTPKEARAAAQRQFGNATLVREDIYRMNSVGWLDSLAQDVRYALRGMRRSPGFTMVTVTTLAIGIGVNAAVFTVTNAELFQGFGNGPVSIFPPSPLLAERVRYWVYAQAPVISDWLD